MKYFSDFQTGKTYNYKTLSLDGTKTVRETNAKYLFSFSTNNGNEIDLHFFPNDNFSAPEGSTFDEKKKRKLNDSRCRYILCEVETIVYDVDGNEHGRDTKFEVYDKSTDKQTFARGKKARYNKDFAPFTRFFSIELKQDGKMVLAPGGVHYGVVPGTLKHGVEVKAVDSLTIV